MSLESANLTTTNTEPIDRISSTEQTLERAPSAPLHDTIRLTRPSLAAPSQSALRHEDTALPRWSWLQVAFAATILVSAFLLFQVQPLISKFILPWFGGSPAVWTTCMLFFQVTLFAGYAYAHGMSKWLSAKAQVVVHLALLGTAIVAMLPTIAPSPTWKPTTSGDPTGRILLLLAATVGLPYFMLSTTGPLLQAWFARVWPTRSPYRLYALSNFGSLVALLTFPFVFVPAFTSDTQATMWSIGFALFVLLCGIVAWQVIRARSPVGSLPGAAAEREMLVANGHTSATQPAAGHRLLWVVLPACASLVLLATTNFVCEDVAVIPFLWVVPLALYLLTFIISFDHPRWYRPLGMSVATLVLIMMSAGGWDKFLDWTGLHTNFLHDLVVYFGTMFFICMVCHGQLVRLRPPADQLTAYYMMISAGGALGGVFVSLIAPRIFRTHLEWTIGLAAGLIAAISVCVSNLWRLDFWLTKAQRGTLWRTAAIGSLLLLFGIGGFTTARWLIRGAAVSPDTIYLGRNFYGCVSVYDVDGADPATHRRLFYNGSVVHGKELVEPDKRQRPISYFSEETGVGRTLTYFQNRPDTRVGVLGMGVAVAAAYSRPGHYYRFYEINELVDDIARNQFWFLEDCKCPFDVIVSDGRIGMERELASGQNQRFDVLVLDAFNGHAPPVHLLTNEAFEIYLQHVKPDGVICVNITSHFVNLVPVINGVAKKHGLGVTRVMTPYDSDKFLNSTDYMMLSRNPDFLAAIPPKLIADSLEPDFEVPLWTDKYSNLFGVLKK